MLLSVSGKTIVCKFSQNFVTTKSKKIHNNFYKEARFSPKFKNRKETPNWIQAFHRILAQSAIAVLGLGLIDAGYDTTCTLYCPAWFQCFLVPFQFNFQKSNFEWNWWIYTFKKWICNTMLLDQFFQGLNLDSSSIKLFATVDFWLGIAEIGRELGQSQRRMMTCSRFLLL